MSLNTLRRHRLVQEVSVEDGGDLLFVYLKPGFHEVGDDTRRSRSFNVWDHEYETGREETTDEAAARALMWLRRDVVRAGK